MIDDRQGSAVLVVIWMTGVLAVLALTFAGRVREASQEVRAAEARLHADAAIDGEFAQLVYLQLKNSRERELAGRDAASAGAPGNKLQPTPPAGGTTPVSALAGEAKPIGTQTSSGAAPDPTVGGLSADKTAQTSEAKQGGEQQDAQAGVMLVQKPITATAVVDDVSLHLHGEPEMGRLDVNHGGPRVLRAFLEKLLDRGMANKAMEATEKGHKRAERAGAVIGSEPMAFLDVDAWLAATGMDAVAAAKLRPYLTTFTHARAVDLIYAPQELIDVLPSLSRSQKDKIAKARKISPEALMQVLAQVAADPVTANAEGSGNGAEDNSGEAARPVLRVTVEATVNGVLHKTEQFVVAFGEGGSGSGAGAADQQEPRAVAGLGASTPKQPKEMPLPFVILDRRSLDAAPSVMAPTGGSPEVAP